MSRVEPFRAPELDRDLEPEHALLALLDVREGSRRRQEPWRELKEDRAELSRRPERLQRRPESFP